MGGYSHSFCYKNTHWGSALDFGYWARKFIWGLYKQRYPHFNLTKLNYFTDNHGMGIHNNKTYLNMIYFLNRKLLVLGEQLLLVKAAAC